MAEITFSEKIIRANRTKENRIKQGDFVFCEGCNTALDFWGIFNMKFGVIALDGASDAYIPETELYLGDTYNLWTVSYRVPCDKMKIFLAEKQ